MERQDGKNCRQLDAVAAADGGFAPAIDGGTLISAENGVYEFEADVTKNPIKQLLRQLSDADGMKDVEISKAPIEQVIVGLYAAWKIGARAPDDTLPLM